MSIVTGTGLASGWLAGCNNIRLCCTNSGLAGRTGWTLAPALDWLACWLALDWVGLDYWGWRRISADIQGSADLWILCAAGALIRLW